MGVFFIILIIITILPYFLYLKINIKNLKLSNDGNTINSKVLLEIYLFNVIPILKTRLDNKKLLESDSKIGITLKKSLSINKIKNLRRVKLYVEKFNLNLYFGIGDILLTTYTVPIIATLITIFLNQENIKIKNKETYYKVNPLFNTNSFLYKISFNCIISINLAHIIFTALMLNNSRKKKASDKFGKPPNRRFNANSNV